MLINIIKELLNVYNVCKKKKTNALFVCTPATAYGGAQQYLYRILEGIKEKEILFIFPYFEKVDKFISELNNRGAQSYCVDYKNKIIIIPIFILFVLILKPKLVHVNSYNSVLKEFCAFLIFIKKFIHVKICITQHLSLFTEEDIEQISAVLKKPYKLLSFDLYRWKMRDFIWKKFVFNNFDKIIFVDRRHWLLGIECLGIDKSKANLILNGIDYRVFRKKILNKDEKKRMREKIGINKDDKIIIGVGNLVEQKRFDLFIECVKIVHNSNISIKGVIVGDGPLLPYLKEKAYSEGIKESIFLLGYRSDIIKLLSLSDVFLMTSKDEGLPYALLEAKSCSLPVVASNVGGIKEIVRHNKDGYIVEFGDIYALAKYTSELIMDQKKLNEFGKAAREDTIERFNIQNMQNKTIGLLKTLYS